jgi:hypothetical protein
MVFIRPHFHYYRIWLQCNLDKSINHCPLRLNDKPMTLKKAQQIIHRFTHTCVVYESVEEHKILVESARDASSLSQPLAYGCSYRAPSLKHLLTFTLLPHPHRHHHHHHHRLTVSAPLLPTPLSLFSQPPNPNFFTGNTLFFRMEVYTAFLCLSFSVLYNSNT